VEPDPVSRRGRPGGQAGGWAAGSAPLARAAMALVGLLGGAAWALGADGTEPAAAAAPLVLDVADFGAVGDGATDDGPAIRRALARAVAHRGPAVVRFEPKTYRLGPWDERWCEVPLIGAEDVTLDGRGALLLVSPTNRAFLLLRCRRVTVRRFRIDYDPLPFTQGDITAVDREAGTFDVRLHDGYPDPPPQAWVEANGPARALWRHGCFVAPDERRYTHDWVYLERVEPVRGAARTWRVVVAAEHRQVLARVAPGMRFVFRRPLVEEAWRRRVTRIGTGPEDRGVYHSNGAASIQVRWSLDCVLEDIDHYLSPNMTVRVTGSDGLVVRRLRITYRPGTDRLTAGLSDGVHAKGCRVGPVIEDCLFEGLFDDSINISTHPDIVIGLPGSGRLLTRYADIAYYDSCLRPGDVVMAWDPSAARLLGEARVLAVRFVRNRVREVTLDRVLEGLRPAGKGDTAAATRLYVRKRRPAVVRRCTFGSQLKTAVLVRDPAVVEECRVSDCAYGVQAANSPRFDEGPPPYRTVVRNNRFERTAVAAVAMVLVGSGGRVEPFGEAFEVVGNRIVENFGFGISVANLRNVSLRDNAIEMAEGARREAVALRIRNAAGVGVEGLRVRDLRPGSPGAVVLTGTPRGEVGLRDVVSELVPGVPAVVR